MLQKGHLFFVLDPGPICDRNIMQMEIRRRHNSEGESSPPNPPRARRDRTIGVSLSVAIAIHIVLAGAVLWLKIKIDRGELLPVGGLKTGFAPSSQPTPRAPIFIGAMLDDGFSKMSDADPARFLYEPIDLQLSPVAPLNWKETLVSRDRAPLMGVPWERIWAPAPPAPKGRRDQAMRSGQ